MKNLRLVKILCLAIILFLSSLFTSYASTGSGIDVNLEVGGCNYNNICDIGQEDMFSCPSDCTPGGAGHPIESLYYNVRIIPNYHSVVIEWKSTIPTISILKWGTTEDYKDGALKNINYLLNHKVVIYNLIDSTPYYFNIESETYKGVIEYLNNQTFTTLYLVDTTPPSNPTNVKAMSTPSGITITWKNPKEIDFDYIRVMRNSHRYYSDPEIGQLVYEGSGEYFTDADVIEGHEYFYTLYSRDRKGNYSSGSMIKIVYRLFHPGEKTDTDDTKNDTSELPKIDEIKKLVNIFKVNQNGHTYDFNKGDSFSLSGDNKITIKVDYTSKIKNDDIWLKIKNNKDNEIIAQYFFTKKLDRDGFINAYIPYFDTEGEYTITIYKYINKLVVPINEGTFHIYKMKINKYISQGYDIYCYLIWLIPLLLILLILLFRYLRKKFKKKKIMPK